MSAKLEITYASTTSWPYRDREVDVSRPLRIAVMDSSWNPPSRAHYAITTYEASSYDAHLLLFSSVNVDKKPHEMIKERTDLMKHIAKRMEQDFQQDDINVAVGTLAAATFADKAPIILDHLRSIHGSKLFTLVFFIGFDTVTRLFMRKYYGDSEQEMERIMRNFFERDGCEVLCARRAIGDVAQTDVADQEEQELLSRPFVKHFADQSKLRFADIEGTEGISSTKIRTILGKDSSRQAKLGELETLTFPEINEYCLESGLYEKRS